MRKPRLSNVSIDADVLRLHSADGSDATLACSVTPDRQAALWIEDGSGRKTGVVMLDDESNRYLRARLDEPQAVATKVGGISA